MANDKEIIKKLLAIATKQQKIITKLAQVPSEQKEHTTSEPPPQHLDPAPTQKGTAAKTLIAALPVGFFDANLVNIEERGSDMVVGFKPGKKTQPNYDTVMSTLQKLTNENKIQQRYNLKAA